MRQFLKSLLVNIENIWILNQFDSQFYHFFICLREMLTVNCLQKIRVIYAQ